MRPQDAKLGTTSSTEATHSLAFWRASPILVIRQMVHKKGSSSLSWKTLFLWTICWITKIGKANKHLLPWHQVYYNLLAVHQCTIWIELLASNRAFKSPFKLLNILCFIPLSLADYWCSLFNKFCAIGGLPQWLYFIIPPFSRQFKFYVTLCLSYLCTTVTANR